MVPLFLNAVWSVFRAVAVVLDQIDLIAVCAPDLAAIGLPGPRVAAGHTHGIRVQQCAHLAVGRIAVQRVGWCRDERQVSAGAGSGSFSTR